MPACSDLLIRSSSGAYGVTIAHGSFSGLLADRPDDVVITDAFFEERLAPRAPRLLSLEAVEANKTISRAEVLIGALRDLGVGRGDCLIAVGGGIIQDVATLVASLYMRGLEWVYAPTTLLGMVDSCIGGKSSLNVGQYKNLAGNFYPPTAIIVDPAFLDTLLPEDRIGGMCEAMKITFCRGPEAFDRYLEMSARALTAPGDDVVALVAHALACKQWFIEVDEFDQKERRQLNFGHTFGHALEAATGFGVSHGVAVGIGVIAADHAAQMLDGEGNPVLRDHALALVRGVPDLAPRLSQFDHDQFRRAFLLDKKHRSGEMRLILPRAAGGTVERALPMDDASMDIVMSALQGAVVEVAA